MSTDPEPCASSDQAKDRLIAALMHAEVAVNPPSVGLLQQIPAWQPAGMSDHRTAAKAELSRRLSERDAEGLIFEIVATEQDKVRSEGFNAVECRAIAKALIAADFTDTGGDDMSNDNAAAEAHRRRIVESIKSITGRPLPTADTIGASYERDTAYERADAIIGQQVSANEVTLALLSIPSTQRVAARFVAERLLEQFNMTHKEVK